MPSSERVSSENHVKTEPFPNKLKFIFSHFSNLLFSPFSFFFLVDFLLFFSLFSMLISALSSPWSSLKLLGIHLINEIKNICWLKAFIHSISISMTSSHSCLLKRETWATKTKLKTLASKSSPKHLI